MSKTLYLIRSAQQISNHLSFISECSTDQSLHVVLLADALFSAQLFLDLGCTVYALEADLDGTGLISENIQTLTYIDFTILIESFDKIVSFS